MGAYPAGRTGFLPSARGSLWVGLVYLVIQQLEGHILVPNIMGSSVGVHPLLVIFSVLAGAQVGVSWACWPCCRSWQWSWTFDFFQLKLSRAPWVLDDGVALGARKPPPEDGAAPADSKER